MLRLIKQPLFRCASSGHLMKESLVFIHQTRTFQVGKFTSNEKYNEKIEDINERSNPQWDNAGLENLLNQLQDSVEQSASDDFMGELEKKIEVENEEPPLMGTNLWPSPSSSIVGLIDRPFQVDSTVQHLVNLIMRDGKKAKAEKIVATALSIIQKETGENPIDVLKQAIAEISPLMKLVRRNY